MASPMDRLNKCLQKKGVWKRISELPFREAEKIRGEIYSIKRDAEFGEPPFDKMPRSVKNYLVKLVETKKMEEMAALYMVSVYESWRIREAILKCVRKTVAPDAEFIVFQEVDGVDRLLVLGRFGRVVYTISDPKLLAVFWRFQLLGEEANRLWEEYCYNHRSILQEKWEFEKKKLFEQWKREVFEYAGIEC